MTQSSRAPVARRVGTAPLITGHMDRRMGSNINGPSLIKMPDWAPGLGRYHLYFADHQGRYIRLAFADRVEGPWQMHEPGALDLEASLFPADDLSSTSPAWAEGLDTPFRYTHIASPDVHVDHAAQMIRMYFHGMVETGAQLTRLALSRDGLAFQPLPDLLGPSYFRVFAYGRSIYAVALHGQVLRAPDWGGPYEPGPYLIPEEMREGRKVFCRHVAVLVADDVLHLFYSRIGDRPEAILHATVPLHGDWRRWQARRPIEILRPELAWEGAAAPDEPSAEGAVFGPARQLRDPAVFTEDGRIWLLYAAAGEGAIGLAELDGL